MVLTALAGGADRGKQGGGVDPGKGVWLKTIYIYIYSCQSVPLILVIGLKTGGAGLEVADIGGGQGTSSGQRVSAMQLLWLP